MTSLEDQVEDLTVMSRGNDVIISGDQIPTSSVGENCSSVVTELLRSDLNYSLEVNKIVSARRVGKNLLPKTQTEGIF